MKEPLINPDNKELTREQVHAWPKVALSVALPLDGARGEGDVAEAARDLAKRLVADSACYAEVVVDAGQAPTLSLAQVCQATQRGLALVEGLTAGVLVHLGENAQAEQAREVVDAVEHGQAIGAHITADTSQEVADILRAGYVPAAATVGAAATVADLERALARHALRLDSAVRLYEDFHATAEEGLVLGASSRWIRDRQLLLTYCPGDEVAAADLADHPQPLLASLGFATALRPGATTSVTDEFLALGEEFDLTIGELVVMTDQAMAASFAPIPVRDDVQARVLKPAWQELAGEFNEDML